MANDSNDVLAAWEQSSQYWNKHQATIEKMLTPLTGGLIAAAQVQPGATVLDIGGGSGEPSLTLSTVVGDSGSVTYTDPAGGMVNSTRVEAERRGLANINFQQTGAESLPFPDNSFDQVVSRLSSMFFGNADQALKEILRVTKPGGRFAFLVWGAREANPFFSVVSEVLNQFVPAEPEDEDAPTAFRYAQSGKLAALLKKAGAREVREDAFPFQIEHQMTTHEFWQLRTEMSDSFRRKLAQLDAAQIAAAEEATTRAVAPYFDHGYMSFPAQALILSGEK